MLLLEDEATFQADVANMFPLWRQLGREEGRMPLVAVCGVAAPAAE